MTPVRRLTIAGATLIVGGGLIAAATRLDWATVDLPPSVVQSPGMGRVILTGGQTPFSGSQLGVGYLAGLGLLIALVPLGWLVAGPRARLILAAAALAIATGAGVGVAIVRSDLPARAERASVQPGEGPHAGVGSPTRAASGSIVALVGVGIAVLGAVGGGFAGRGIPALRMPERPGDAGGEP